MCFSVDPKRFVAEHIFIRIQNIFFSLDYRACPLRIEFFLSLLLPCSMECVYFVLWQQIQISIWCGSTYEKY